MGNLEYSLLVQLIAPMLKSTSLIQEALLHKRAHGNSFGQLTLLGFKQGFWALGFAASFPAQNRSEITP